MLESRNDLFVLLGRDPRALIGEPETTWLEFKSSPYPVWLEGVEGDRHKFELAKDVSALANKDGGVLLIGVQTERDPDSQEDTATELRPVDGDLVNPQRLKQVVYDWVFPRLDVEIRSHPISESAGQLWSIAVERHRERDYPHVVTRNFVGEGGANTNIFGVFERSGTDNVAYSPRQVHGWLGRGSDIGDQAEDQPVGYVQPATPEEAEDVLREDLAALELPEHSAALILQAACVDGRPLTNFYRGGPESLHERLRHPSHHLRKSGGFDLPDITTPERTNRGALSVSWKGEDSISVTPGGLATAIQGEEHLTWASERFAPKDSAEKWINPMSLIEFTLDFFRFFLGEVLPRSGTQNYQWRAGMVGVLEGPLALYLPEQLDVLTERDTAKEDSFLSAWSTSTETEAARVAFQVLAGIYGSFGFDVAVMPYSGDGTVDETAILDIGKR